MSTTKWLSTQKILKASSFLVHSKVYATTYKASSGSKLSYMHKFVSLGFEHKDFGMQILKPLAQFEDNISGQLKYIISLAS